MALTTCRIRGAVLVIGRLDRLSRNVAMIARLMESGLDFVATDFPYANKFTFHVLAAVAEYESRIQSERMKAVLAALKQRGNKVGNTKRDSTLRFPSGCQQASAQPPRLASAHAERGARFPRPCLRCWLSSAGHPALSFPAPSSSRFATTPSPSAHRSACRIQPADCDLPSPLTNFVRHEVLSFPLTCGFERKRQAGEDDAPRSQRFQFCVSSVAPGR